MAEEQIKLTTFSHGSGCGCKIAPAKLEAILGNKLAQEHKQLLVGNSAKDDAAVYDLGENQALIFTTDFFMPIVNSAYDFGRIAAANALSDVYAMGGKPIMALAVLGWPTDKLSTELAAEVMQGGIDVCKQANIPLAGGHSIDNSEPLFGLAVNGLVEKKHLKQNSTAKEGDKLYITKPLGLGILATAIKRGLATNKEIDLAVNVMTKLNDIGMELAKINGIHAMTDVTGFGLAGHLLEMCEGAALSAQLHFNSIPLVNQAMIENYVSRFVLPDNTYRNYNSYAEKIGKLDAIELPILCDPQTSGGLLISVGDDATKEVESLLKRNGMQKEPIGEMTAKKDKFIEVKP